MKTQSVLKQCVDSFTLLDLVRRVATHKGLRVEEGASKAYSQPIHAYALDDRRLALLAERGITQEERPDCHGQIFTLVDRNPQEEVPGWAVSNYWNFKLLHADNRRHDLRISLSVGFQVSHGQRGIILSPRAHGPFLSPCDRLPNFRMFKALVESDGTAAPVAQELAASEGTIVVTWTELGLGGIRKLTDLFAEFMVRNEEIKRIADRGDVFTPAPYLHNQQPGDALFIVEPAQPRVFSMWRAQLETYRASLVV